jgi:hypothetical protein
MAALVTIRRIDQGGFGNVDVIRDARGQEFARKTFSKNQPRDRLQRIALLGERREPVVRIEKTELRHRPAPTSVPS